PESGLRSDAADADVAAAVERAAVVIVFRREGDAVARTDWKLPTACHHSARIRIDVACAGFRPRGPGADRDGAEGCATAEREPRGAKPDNRRDTQRKDQSDKQAHDRSSR